MFFDPRQSDAQSTIHILVLQSEECAMIHRMCPHLKKEALSMTPFEFWICHPIDDWLGLNYFTRKILFCWCFVTAGIQTPRNLWQWSFGRLWRTCSVVLVGADRCCRDGFYQNLCLPYLISIGQTHHQTRVHSRYYKRCHTLPSQWWATVWSVPGHWDLPS